MSEIDKDLPELLIDQPMLVAPWAESETVESRLSGWLRQCRAKARAGKKAPSELLSLGDLVAQQRLRKDEAEIQTMRQAAAMSAKAHCLAMQATQPGLAEHAIEAVLLNAFRGQGGRVGGLWLHCGQWPTQLHTSPPGGPPHPTRGRDAPY